MRNSFKAACGRFVSLITHIGAIPLCFLGIFGYALWFHWMYCGAPETAQLVFDLGWSLLLTAVAAVLPRRARRIFLIALAALLFVLTLVHGVFFNMFRRFFSFSDLFFAGDGAAFFDSSYIVVRKLAVLLGLACSALLAAAALLPGSARPKAAAVSGLLALALLGYGSYTFLRGSDVMIWDMADDPAVVYDSFTDSKAAVRLLGLYQYTFRDVQLAVAPGGGITDAERAEADKFAAARGGHEANAMSGIFEGKNLLLVQLEAIDTWMLDYMPALSAVKEQSIVFDNHYSVAYITAGTFNTEFIVNTGLLPASAGTPVSVYTRGAFPYSLPNLFRAEGYTARSFHGSPADVYCRGEIHENLGYESYSSGADMGMEDYTMDSQLICAFDEMTSPEPFFSFVITYSGHGPYGEDDPIYLAHAGEAREAAKMDEGNYVYAVAHAMETDAYIAELVDALESSGRADDTVVIFYADHYNYYMLNDALNMIIKGVDNLNLLQHTDFFIYAPGVEPMTVEKYTSGIDILPTIANLFGLDAPYPLLTGDDAFSDGGGYVFFNDNTVIGDGGSTAEAIKRRHISSIILDGYWE